MTALPASKGSKLQKHRTQEPRISVVTKVLNAVDYNRL